MELILRVETGQHQGLTFSTNQAGSYQLGRSAEADIVLNEDKYVSRKHCLIEVAAQEVTIRDVGSSGGTFVNARRISEAQLSDGDMILVGQTTIRVSIAGATAARPSFDLSRRVAGFTLVKKLPGEAVGRFGGRWPNKPAGWSISIFCRSMSRPRPRIGSGFCARPPFAPG